MMNEDTICALGTPQGVGALGIVRVSGKDALTTVNKIFKGKDLTKVSSHTVQYGFIMDGEEVIDEVLLSVFLAPKTFTAEDLVEITCHGSNYILQSVLNLLVKNNCRLALAGEFTQRAFINGRIDLSQAEAVVDLIEAENKASHDIAIQQMRGGFSDTLKDLREQLLNFASLLELELDFSEEDIEFADRTQLLGLMDKILDNINPLIESFSYGNAIKNGVPVAIIGKPNAGKSTLLNALLKEERAIVSNIAGTTRDTIEESIIIKGVEFKFIDTAGIRETNDEIEAIGVNRAIEKANSASVVLYLVDGEKVDWGEVRKDLEKFSREGNKVILSTTKHDLVQVDVPTDISDTYTSISISAKENISLEELKDIMYDYIESQKVNSQTIVVNARHLDALSRAKESLLICKEGLGQNLSGELVVVDLRRGLEALGEIVGEVSNDELLGNIFGKFCIGK